MPQRAEKFRAGRRVPAAPASSFSHYKRALITLTLESQAQRRALISFNSRCPRPRRAATAPCPAGAANRSSRPKALKPYRSLT